MSYSIDVNILLYASNAGCSEHAKSSACLAECAASRELLCLAWPTLMGYLRIATPSALF